MSAIVKQTDNLDVTFNEFTIQHTLQRMIDRLFENDMRLKSFYSNIFGNLHIYEYQPGAKYEYNDVVWFLDSKPVTYTMSNGIKLTYRNLHVLRCDSNIIYGNLEYYPQKSFAELGWKDLNANIDILNDFYIKKWLDSYFSNEFRKHQNDERFHAFGKLSYDPKKKDFIGGKIATNNLDNLNAHRDRNFFPYETTCLASENNSAIIGGYARWYENGLLEYDIVFRLGYQGYQEIDSKYHISANMVKANNLDLIDEVSDDKYFNSMSDKNIFVDNTEHQSEINSTVQTNRNDFVNVYSATIEFAKAAGNGNIAKTDLYQFEDESYMVFCSDVMSQIRNSNEQTVSPSPCTMTFCSKKPGSITAVLVTYPDGKTYDRSGENASQTGLASNSFHCHIVGKGKKRQ